MIRKLYIGIALVIGGISAYAALCAVSGTKDCVNISAGSTVSCGWQCSYAAHVTYHNFTVASQPTKTFAKWEAVEGLADIAIWQDSCTASCADSSHFCLAHNRTSYAPCVHTASSENFSQPNGVYCSPDS